MFAVRRTIQLLSVAVLYSLVACANVSAQSADDFLGIKLRPEVQRIVKEIEQKTNQEIYAEFIEQKDFVFGTSYVSDGGAAVVAIDFRLQDDRKKLEAVITHELLHLRLRVNNYPTFAFSLTIQTARGRAIDVEQSNVNDLLSMIEHRIFRTDMQKFGVYDFINLAGDTEKGARQNKGEADGQADSINYARAILEYQTAADIEAVKRAYEANGWKRALENGKAIADIINQTNPQTPKAIEEVFLKCLLKLYPIPPTHTFKLTVDPKNRFFRQMIITTARKSGSKNK